MTNTLLIVFFIIGYLAIIFERFLHVNKAAIALVMGVVTWLILFQGSVKIPNEVMNEHISNIAQVIFFLLAAMVIVEIIDSHQGFKPITDILYTSSKKKMLWFLIGVSFFMSAILDNLTTMIVIVSLLNKMVKSKRDRWFLGSIVVICVNAGGAWTPIGDVTTTMLWINDRITTWQTIRALFIPSAICALAAGILGSFFVDGKQQNEEGSFATVKMEPAARRVLLLGLLALVMIPVWKAVFGLAPFMGALLGLGILWLITDLIHFRYGEERWHLRVLYILTKVDFSGVLFFLGILLAVDSLTASGILKTFAEKLQAVVPNQNWVAVILGLISSVIDNVPLVQATIGMYDVAKFPIDSQLWQLIAYAAGTGGSILIIGSAAGVAFMGLEKVDFLWYLKHISWIALIAYFAGIIAYFLLI